MEIENGGNTHAAQAAVNTYEPLKRVGIKFYPSRFAKRFSSILLSFLSIVPI